MRRISNSENVVMQKLAYRYAFGSAVALESIEASIVLAILATEFLHGEVQTQLDAGYFLDFEKRTLIVDASTSLGCDFNRLLLGFIRQDVDAESLEIERVETEPARPAA